MRALVCVCDIIARTRIMTDFGVVLALCTPFQCAPSGNWDLCNGKPVFFHLSVRSMFPLVSITHDTPRLRSHLLYSLFRFVSNKI